MPVCTKAGAIWQKVINSNRDKISYYNYCYYC